MSDGVIILIFFMALILIPVGIVFLVIGINKNIRKRKRENYKGRVMGTVRKIEDRGMDFPWVIYVVYNVNGMEYQIHESAKLKTEAIRIGKIPIGQRKTFVMGPVKSGDEVVVCYDEKNPANAIIQGNEGVITS